MAATSRPTYRGNYSGIGRMMQRPWMQRGVRKSAVQMREAAEANSPRESGEYASSFDIVPLWKNIPFKGKPRMRAGARLVNTSDHARHVEYGNGGTPRYAVLHKAIDTMKAAHGA